MRDIKSEVDKSESSASKSKKPSPKDLIFPKKEMLTPNESTEEVNFKEQLIGYILDEMDNGFTLKQVKVALVDQGYEEDEIEFGLNYVKTRFKKKVKGKDRSDKTHLKQRFLIPVAAILLLIVSMIGIFYLVKGVDDQAIEEQKDFLAFHKLDLDPNTQTILDSKIIMDLSIPIENRKIDAFLRSKKGSPFFDALEPATTVNSVYKRVTIFTTTAGEKTLVELRFSVSAPTDSFKLLEIIPKKLVDTTDKITTDAKVIDTDPIIEWSFSRVTPSEQILRYYVIDESISSYASATYPVIQKIVKTRGQTICGNSICEVGESYLSCCNDCGCLPGFECKTSYCDPISRDKCKSDFECDDLEPSTRDYCGGAPKICRHEPFCNSGDGVCPSICAYQNDTDCKPPTEEYLEKANLVLDKTIPPWHPEFVCSEDWMCTDGNTCTIDLCNSDSTKCYWEDIDECIDDDHCCPASCTELSDNDC